MRHTYISLALILTVSGFAFEKGLPPGAQYHLEKNQEAVAQEQAFQGKVAEVGGVQADITPNRGPSTAAPDATAQQTVELANQREAARLNLVSADDRAKEIERPKSNTRWIWGIIIGGLGFGIIFGARKWADKNLPEMPKTKRVKW